MAEIIDNTEQEQFEMAIGDGVGFVKYRRRGNRLHLMHAEVPPTVRGKGYGAHLVKAVLDRARTEGVRVVSHCWFVSAFLEAHPEYQDLTKLRDLAGP